MATFRTVEDIQAWQRSRELARDVYAETKGDGFSRDFSLRDQMRRSAVSVVSNIAEGFGRGTTREFANFLFIARGSVSELRTQIILANDFGYIPETTLRRLAQQCSETHALISGLISYLQGTTSKTPDSESIRG